MSLLQIDTIDVYYGRVKVLDGISVSITKGEVVTIIGANGAGKTTLLKTLSGLLHPRKGKITYLDEDISRVSPEGIARKGISHIPQGREIFGPLTVMDNLILGAYPRIKKGVRRREIERDIESIFSMFPVLKERQKQLAGTLSGGEQQMVAIGRALMSKPLLLLLDEPSMGLAPMVTRDILNNLRQLNNEQGISLLLVEQNVNIALSFAERTYVLDTGKITNEGKGSELLRDGKITEAYLGKVKNNQNSNIL